MCLIAFAWQAHADYPLVVAANRDEFFARPTASARWWPDDDLLAGRDLRAGGTWMGVTRGGRFAALTNFRDPSSQRPDAPSRGALVGDFLTDAGPAGPALARIAAGAARFNGFNLLAAQWHADDGPVGAWALSGPEASMVVPVAPGVHALSNARLGVSWPKVDYVVEQTREALATATDTATLVERLMTMLGDRTVASDDRLPGTGIPLEVERALSAPFIRMPGYGTRASTVFVVDRRGRTTFVERRFEPDAAVEESRFAFETAVSGGRSAGLSVVRGP